MPRPKLTLYVDIVSPFAYLAFHVIRNNATFKAVDVEYIPVFLGGIMQETGNRPPISVPSKGVYLMRDRQRWEKRFNIPMADRMPEPFPQSTLQTARALCAIQTKYPSKLQDAVAELYKAFFVDLKPIGKPETISAVLSQVLSKSEVEDVMALSQQPDIKKMLLDNTKAALEQGAFGLPYYIATNAKGETDTFWGFDALGQVVHHLGVEAKGDGFRALL